MGIQVRRTGSADYGRYIRALIAGEPGSGKTLISSTFPDVIYASAEGGLMSVSDRNVMSVDIKNSADLLELKQHLDQGPKIREKFFGGPVETVVVDTIDEVARILQKERLTETKKETLAMQDWGWFGEQLRGIIRGFRNLEMHVVFTCHVKTVEDNETGGMFVKPAIQGSVGDEIAGYVDLALLLQARPHSEIVNGETKRSVIRYLQTYQDPRHPWIKDRSGKLPMEFPVNFQDDFKRMDALIYGSVQQTMDSQTAKEAAEVAEMAQELAREPEVAPEPEPEPEPEPSLEEQFAAEDRRAAEIVAKTLDSSAESEPVEQSEESVPTAGTETPSGALVCVSCQGDVENADQAELSNMRFRKTLCRKCFVEMKRK